jgi:hypothetical protein
VFKRLILFIFRDRGKIMKINNVHWKEIKGFQKDKKEIDLSKKGRKVKRKIKENKYKELKEE